MKTPGRYLGVTNLLPKITDLIEKSVFFFSGCLFNYTTVSMCACSGTVRQTKNKDHASKRTIRCKEYRIKNTFKP